MVYVKLNVVAQKSPRKRNPLGIGLHTGHLCKIQYCLVGGNFKTFRLWHGGRLLLLARVIVRIKKEWVERCEKNKVLGNKHLQRRGGCNAVKAIGTLRETTHATLLI